MSRPKLHHYLPQFILREFAAPNGRVYVFDKQLSRSFPSNPENLAAESRFYNFQFGQQSFSLEKWL